MEVVAFPLVGHGEYAPANDCVPPLRAKGGDCGGGSEALIVTTHDMGGPVGTLCASGAGTTRPAGNANELDFLIVHSAGFSAGNAPQARGIAYTDEGTPPLRAGPSGTNQVPTVITTVLADAPAPADDADRHEADARDILAAIKASVGAPAYLHWGACVLAGLRMDAKLAAWMAGGNLRRETEEARSNGDGLNLVDVGHALQSVWLDGPNGATPEGREMAKQLTLDLGEALALAPEEGADERHLHLLRELAEGARRLRLALADELAASGRRSRQVKWIVRRLTPVEAERLQGFPDNHTAITINGKPVEDGPRYKAIGNSMATNCMRFIGERLHAAHLESLAEIEASRPAAA